MNIKQEFDDLKIIRNKLEKKLKNEVESANKAQREVDALQKRADYHYNMGGQTLKMIKRVDNELKRVSDLILDETSDDFSFIGGRKKRGGRYFKLRRRQR